MDLQRLQEKHRAEVASLQNKIDHLKWLNNDTAKQLSDTAARTQRLVTSLGFSDVHEAQVVIETADTEVRYKESLDLVQRLKDELRLERAEVVRLRERLKLAEDRALKVRTRYE
jgi:acyl-CoA thioesterase FadM